MTLQKVYEQIKEIQLLTWRDDDLMGQDTLFTVQDRLADLTLSLAIECGKTDDLLKTFPWLYAKKKG